MALQFVRENSNDFTITAYDGASVRIGATTFAQSVSLSHDTPAAVWPGKVPMTADLIARGTSLNAEIVIIGTGAKHVFPNPEALRPLIDARIGFELMNSSAACRTYNVLLAEGRKVGLLLVIE
jgi:uncharacterized protein